MVNTPAEFIKTVGIAGIAKATGRTVGAIRVWKARNRFPREAWLELNTAYPALTLDELKRLEGHGEPAAPPKDAAA